MPAKRAKRPTTKTQIQAQDANATKYPLSITFNTYLKKSGYTLFGLPTTIILFLITAVLPIPGKLKLFIIIGLVVAGSFTTLIGMLMLTMFIIKPNLTVKKTHLEIPDADTGSGFQPDGYSYDYIKNKIYVKTTYQNIDQVYRILDEDEIRNLKTETLTSLGKNRRDYQTVTVKKNGHTHVFKQDQVPYFIKDAEVDPAGNIIFTQDQETYLQNLYTKKLKTQYVANKQKTIALKIRKLPYKNPQNLGIYLKSHNKIKYPTLYDVTVYISLEEPQKAADDIRARM